MNNVIHIGIEPKTVITLGEVILQILASDQDQSTIQKALTTLELGTRVSGVSISDCTFNSEKAEEK